MASAIKVFTQGDLNDNPVYVGIDQSYSGFAITLLNDTGYSITVYKSPLRGIDRLADIKHYMSGVLQFKSIKDVAMEDYAFAGQGRVFHLGELGGLVKITLHELGPYYPLLVPPTSLKKYVTGKGQGISKSQILLHVYKKWGIELNDDNAADSYALAHLVSGRHSLAYEKEIYAKLQDPKFREK